jgi:hypothetical protein
MESAVRAAGWCPANLRSTILSGGTLVAAIIRLWIEWLNLEAQNRAKADDVRAGK